MLINSTHSNWFSPGKDVSQYPTARGNSQDSDAASFAYIPRTTPYEAKSFHTFGIDLHRVLAESHEASRNRCLPIATCSVVYSCYGRQLDCSESGSSSKAMSDLCANRSEVRTGTANRCSNLYLALGEATNAGLHCQYAAGFCGLLVAGHR